jgi:hypothetical protein
MHIHGPRLFIEMSANGIDEQRCESDRTAGRDLGRLDEVVQVILRIYKATAITTMLD